MKLTELCLKNFRNYSNLKLNFKKPIILFFGANAQGKTNLLEAIYYLATGKSHRAQKEKELIRWETSGFYLKGELEKEQAQYTLEIITNYQNGKNKNLKVNNLSQTNTRNFLKTMNVVIFSPEDLMLVKGTPDNRRRFIDQEITQVDPSYDFYLKNYFKALRQRNKLLKTYQDKNTLAQHLPPWNQQLVHYGSKIILKREEVIHKIRLLARLIYRKITNQTENLELDYSPSLEFEDCKFREQLSGEKLAHKFLNTLNENLQSDIEKRTTSIGPHRDDLIFKINNKDARQFGSQGQQRTTVLALKMAELEMIKGEKGEFPILLLDDVLSELDDNRKKHLLNLTEGRVQTFVTSTSMEDFNGDVDIKAKSQVFRIDNGEAVKLNAGNQE
ncbi:DNA replication/repair protein RecF [Natranaerobius thermophilus]|uniref:DNA replication and repair protein RecF n=1 Tax=Natranaerobius thermophilus (strain ATCC BAA-1301 / DSM 18059 / JW/NM-WN-LF) TaxID=457570 RepID=RECF_NATTJ|nr:DNA replication/repair protein RecF [Natranaerobius thermophilus]B2A2Y9.1 RecName: Full=DNA replication and repair protein RecF [Natranaerobius thermophilus JW/NM-WN-LF]ACB83603.1 DNA replication and repair protein RecF [Natranaerobius thermophilus JW/NM-WN-LF]